MTKIIREHLYKGGYAFLGKYLAMHMDLDCGGTYLLFGSLT